MVGENMEMFIGALIAVFFFVCLIITFFYGYQLGKKNTRHKKESNEETMRIAEQLQKDFQSVMKYDVTTALQRKKVTDIE
jgi:preprotein translocase subunit SecG